MTIDIQFLEQFCVDLSSEVERARMKFPQPNPNVAALAEETGELAKAVLHIRERKSTSWNDVYAEAVQVAAMAARIALEGDETIGVTPTSEITK